jgi:hypothetical protein
MLDGVGQLEALHFPGAAFASATTADRQMRRALMPKPSDVPQFGPILRAVIQRVKKAVSSVEGQFPFPSKRDAEISIFSSAKPVIAMLGSAVDMITQRAERKPAAALPSLVTRSSRASLLKMFVNPAFSC